jgi:uncharacterized protein
LGRLVVRYYLDAAPVIYTVERISPYVSSVAVRLSANDAELVASDLTRLECRVKPLKNGDLTLLRDFDDYFSHTCDAIISLSSAIMDLATEIRAQYGFRTPDAMHIAAAVEAKCDVFLTNDFRLARFAGITIDSVGI